MYSVLLTFLPLFAVAAPALPPPQHGGVYVIAHRGLHADRPENSLPSIEGAIALGCDFVELDVRTTADGQLVCVHNDAVDAYVDDGTTGKVRDLTLAQLRALDIGARHGEAWRGTRIPTFDEAAAACAGRIGIYLDLKDAEIAPVLEVVRRHGLAERTVWYAGPARLREVAEQCPQCLPMPDPGSERLLPTMLERFATKVVATTWGTLSANFVATAHAAGALVFSDEEDADPAEWAQALAWGTDGIQTDDPAALIAWLQDQAPASASVSASLNEPVRGN